MVLVRAAERFVLDQALRNMMPVAGRSVVEEWLMVLAGILVFVASGLLVWSAYLWFTQNYPPEMAAAATGLIALGLALVFFLSALGIWYVKYLRMKKLQMQIADILHLALERLSNEISEPVQDNPKKAAAIASLAGFAAGRRFL